MAFIDAPGGRLHYRVDESSRAAAPTLVFSNSLGTTLEMWDRQMASFTPHFRVVRYDTRGHGQSDTLSQNASVAELGGDVVRLLDHLGVERAHFVGLSMGGQTGMWLGANRGERIRRLVLCNTAALIGPASIWDERIETVKKAGVAALAPAVIARWFTQDFVDRHADAVRPIEAMLLAAREDGYIASCAAVRDADLRGELGRIEAATLVVAGSHDPATTVAQSFEIVASLRNGRLLELDAAHLSNIEASAAFNQGVVEFLLGDGHG
jgi:3-oxoadipate enol-lactonase